MIAVVRVNGLVMVKWFFLKGGGILKGVVVLKWVVSFKVLVLVKIHTHKYTYNILVPLVLRGTNFGSINFLLS